MWGQVTGTRALQRWKLIVAFIQSKAQPVFEAEQAGSFSGPTLDKVTKDIDKTAATQLDARWRLEHMDAYCLARDHRYGRRSRRWLQARALNGKLNGAYAEWATFVRENDVVVPGIRELPAQDVNTLADKPFKEIMTT